MQAWAPSPVVLGYKSGPRLAGPKLGQISQSVVDQASRSVIAEAEPRFRTIVREERSLLARAAIESLPYMGGAATVFLAATYLVPKESKTLKGVGYVGAAGLAAFGAWRALDAAAGPEELSAPPAPSDGGGGLPFISGAAQQLAQAIVREAEPKVRALVDDERAKIGSAVENSLPYLGISAAAFLATAYFVPDGKNSWKAAGYMSSVAALLIGAWRGLSVASE